MRVRIISWYTSFTKQKGIIISFLRLSYVLYQPIPVSPTPPTNFFNPFLHDLILATYCIDVLKRTFFLICLCLQPSDVSITLPPPSLPSLLHRPSPPSAEETFNRTANSETPPSLLLLLRIVSDAILCLIFYRIVILALNLCFHNPRGSLINRLCDIFENVLRSIDSVIELDTNHHRLGIFPFRRRLLLLHDDCSCSANFVQSFTTFSRQSSREPRFSSFRDDDGDVGEDITAKVDALMESDNLDRILCWNDYALHCKWIWVMRRKDSKAEWWVDRIVQIAKWLEAKLVWEFWCVDEQKIKEWNAFTRCRREWSRVESKREARGHQKPSEMMDHNSRNLTSYNAPKCFSIVGFELLCDNWRAITTPSPLAPPPSPFVKTKQMGLRNRVRFICRSRKKGDGAECRSL